MWLQPVVRDPRQVRFLPTFNAEELTDEERAADSLRLHHFLSPDHRPSKTEMIFFQIRPFSSVQRPRVVSTPPEPSSPMPTPSAPVFGPANMPRAAEPADDWLEGVEHPARAGKSKKGGKKGKKGSSKGRGRGAGRPASDVELSDDEGGVVATEAAAAHPLDDLEWIEGTADTAPARKARRKRKKGRKGRGGGTATAEEAEGKVEGRVGSEGEQSDEDGGEGGAEAEDRVALHTHGEDATVDLVESLSEAPAPVSDRAGDHGDGLSSEAEPPAWPSGPAGGEQVK
jgi:hypothetical protein